MTVAWCRPANPALGPSFTAGKGWMASFPLPLLTHRRRVRRGRGIHCDLFTRHKCRASAATMGFQEGSLAGDQTVIGFRL